MALGKEGPLVHIGACIASLLGQVSPNLLEYILCVFLGCRIRLQFKDLTSYYFFYVKIWYEKIITCKILLSGC